jgi:hypothetical protein
MASSRTLGTKARGSLLVRVERTLRAAEARVLLLRAFFGWREPCWHSRKVALRAWNVTTYKTALLLSRKALTRLAVSAWCDAVRPSWRGIPPAPGLRPPSLFQ